MLPLLKPFSSVKLNLTSDFRTYNGISNYQRKGFICIYFVSCEISILFHTNLMGYLDNHSRGVCSKKVATDKNVISSVKMIQFKWTEETFRILQWTTILLYGDITHIIPQISRDEVSKTWSINSNMATFVFNNGDAN